MKRAELARLLATALRELDPAARVAGALPSASRRMPARVVAIGKAAPAMAAGAIARWGKAIERCLVVAPEGTAAGELRRAAERAGISDRLVVMHAAHPLPDARSVRAGAACLAMVSSPRPRRVLVLVSGGASSLACSPIPGITLRTMRAITRAMLESGASVQEINVVRKHLSRLKGGGLARAAGGSSLLTVVASDVIGGRASDVGSGPSVVDRTTVSDARRLLRRFAPSFADVPLARTFSIRSGDARRFASKVVLSPEDLAKVFARGLRERVGIDVRVLPASQAGAEELAAEYRALAELAARRVARGGPACAFVRAAEPSVVVPGPGGKRGRGGRATHVAALVAHAFGDLGDHDPRVHEGLRHALFAAFASDGVDGASGTAGAVVDDRFAARVAARLGPDALSRALASFDTGSLHRTMKTALASAPTGHYLADLHVLVIGGGEGGDANRAAKGVSAGSGRRRPAP